MPARPGQRDRRLQAGLDVPGGVHREERGLRRGEPCHDLGREIGVAGRVDQLDPRALVLEAGDREGQRLLALLLLGLVVQAGRAVVDAAEPGDRAGVEEKPLGQRRLAGAGVGGQDDAAEVGEVDTLGCHAHRSFGGVRSHRGRGRWPGTPRPRSRTVGCSPARGLRRLRRLYSGRCQDTPSGRRSSARRAPTTSSAVPSSPRWAARSAVAARAGGADPDGNFRLRLAIERPAPSTCRWTRSSAPSRRRPAAAKASSSRRSRYEGYGPGGVAILVETATDNKNRTAADIRSILTKAGGQLAGAGGVAWQFEQRGVITLAPAETPRSWSWPHRRRRRRRRLDRRPGRGLHQAPRAGGGAPVPRGGGREDRVGRAVDDRQEHVTRAGTRPARRCAWSSCSRTTTTSSAYRQLRDPRGADGRGRRMIILGIDPGTAMLGYGIVERTGQAPRHRLRRHHDSLRPVRCPSGSRPSTCLTT